MSENDETKEPVSGEEEQAAASKDGDDDVVFPEDENGDDAEAQPEEPTELEKAVHERGRMRDQLLRIAADFDNFRKRSRKEMDETRRRAVEDTLREVLPIVDNLERAAQAARDTKDVEAVAEGVSMVLRGFEDIANRLNLKRLRSVGQTFDPNLHDAMQQQETNEHPPGTIVSEIVPGYELGDRLLRPAVVVVARPKTDAGGAEDEGETDPTGEEQA